MTEHTQNTIQTKKALTVNEASENTGKALVYTWMEPVLSALITIPSGLGIGLILYMIPEDSS